MTPPARGRDDSQPAKQEHTFQGLDNQGSFPGNGAHEYRGAVPEADAGYSPVVKYSLIFEAVFAPTISSSCSAVANFTPWTEPNASQKLLCPLSPDAHR